MNDKKGGELFILLATICWSTSAVLTKPLGIEPLLSNALRGFIAVFVLLIFNKFTVRFNKIIAIAAICGMATTMLFFIALDHTAAANAIVLQYTAPIFVLLFVCISEKRLPTKGQAFVVLMAFSGVAVIFASELGGGGMLGNICALFAGLFFAGVFFINRQKGARPVDSSIIAFALCAVLGVFYIPTILSLTPVQWGLVLCLGLVQHGLAYVFFSIGIRRCASFSASLIGMLETVLVPLWVFLVFNEKPSVNALIGCSMIIFAVCVNTYLEKKAELA